jgi:hypothetical protein
VNAEETLAWGERYYTELAAAFVRGKLADAAILSNVDAIALGLEYGLRLHKFKRQAELPRVRKVGFRENWCLSDGSAPVAKEKALI